MLTKLHLLLQHLRLFIPRFLKKYLNFTIFPACERGSELHRFFNFFLVPEFRHDEFDVSESLF
jgi:hypothetical protein